VESLPHFTFLETVLHTTLISYSVILDQMKIVFYILSSSHLSKIFPGPLTA